ncbi:MAG: MarR family winged helix-turn-helix transcriptional regulator [Thermodesulfobacteriota bacterium]
MNKYAEAKSPENDSLLDYQTQRLKSLIGEMVHCCQDRMVFQARKFDLPQAELRCLMLFGDERYLTVKSIAQRLEVAKSRVTKILEGMESRGLVSRTDDPRDGRVRLIGLTPEGRRRAQAVADFVHQIHQQILLRLPAEERQAIIAALENLRVAMEAVKRELK